MSKDPYSDSENDREDMACQAERCRRLADSVSDRQTIASLTELAREYDTRAQSHND